MPKEIHAVIFDLDGLMVDTERISKWAWDKVSLEYNIKVEEPFYSLARGKNYEGVKKVFETLYGKEISYDELWKKKHDWFDHYIEYNGIPTKKGLFELIHYLKSHNYKFAVSSGSSKKHVQKVLDIIGLDEITIIIGGDMVTYCKPHPESFLQAALQLNEKPENCVVLEDSLNGIKAAIDGGFSIIMIPDMIQSAEQYETLLDGKYDNLEEVILFLEKNSSKY